MELSDAELITRSLVDPERFGQIFDRHAVVLHRYLARRIGPDAAQDLLGDVFCAAFEVRQSYDPTRPLALPWLYGIASNQIGKFRAAEARRLAATAKLLRDGGVSDDLAASVAGRLDSVAAWVPTLEAIGALPNDERDTLVLYAWEELSYAEVAAALDVPVGTVRSRLNRARRRLAGLVDEFDIVRRVRPDRISPEPAASDAALARAKERLMQAIEGKTKVVEDAGNGEVLIRSKDDITAGDGAKHDVLEGKAAASTRTTCNIFGLLERNGVPTHFVDRVNDVTFRARNVEMIPLELVARRYATGSFMDRLPHVPDGTVFEELIFEVFEKDDANHDPLLEFDFDAGVLRRYVPNNKAAAAIGPHVNAGDLISEQPLGTSRYAAVSLELIAELRSRTVRTFEVIEEAWKQHGGVYIDFKIECGFDRETGELLVADVIDSDSGRLRFGDVDMSKQSYRDGTATLPEIKKKFDEVANLTDSFI